jgi:hypothetical protein
MFLSCVFHVKNGICGFGREKTHRFWKALVSQNPQTKNLFNKTRIMFLSCVYHVKNGICGFGREKTHRFWKALVSQNPQTETFLIKKESCFYHVSFM